MGKNQYIGLRYVPLIGGEWVISNEYEPLTVVLFQGASYTSKTHVPKNIDIKNTSYWVLTGDYNAQVSEYKLKQDELETNVSYLDNSVSPQMFGAIGDGVTDDYLALQNAINYASTAKKPLVSHGGYKYYVSSKLTISKPLDMDFHTAQIVSSNSDGILYVAPPNSYSYNGHITGIRFNYDGEGVALQVNARDVFIDKCDFININKTAIKLDGDSHGTYIQNSTLTASNTRTGSIAFIINTPDNEFSNIRVVNFDTVFTGNVGLTYFKNVHAFINSTALKNVDKAENSIFADFTGGSPSFTQCYSDTYKTTFKVSSAVDIRVNQFVCFINRQFYNQENGITATPDFIYCTDGATSRRFSISNSYFNGGNEDGINFCTNGVYRGSIYGNYYSWVKGLYTSLRANITLLPTSVDATYQAYAETHGDVNNIFLSFHVANTQKGQYVKLFEYPSGGFNVNNKVIYASFSTVNLENGDMSTAVVYVEPVFVKSGSAYVKLPDSSLPLYCQISDTYHSVYLGVTN